MSDLGKEAFNWNEESKRIQSILIAALAGEMNYKKWFPM